VLIGNLILYGFPLYVLRQEGRERERKRESKAEEEEKWKRVLPIASGKTP